MMVKSQTGGSPCWAATTRRSTRSAKRSPSGTARRPRCALRQALTRDDTFTAARISVHPAVRETTAAPQPSAPPSSEGQCHPRSGRRPGRRGFRRRSHARRPAPRRHPTPFDPVQQPVDPVRSRMPGLFRRGPPFFLSSGATSARTWASAGSCGSDQLKRCTNRPCKATGFRPCGGGLGAPDGDISRLGRPKPGYGTARITSMPTPRGSFPTGWNQSRDGGHAAVLHDIDALGIRLTAVAASTYVTTPAGGITDAQDCHWSRWRAGLRRGRRWDSPTDAK